MISSVDVNSWTTQYWENNSAECTTHLKNEALWNQIPSVNVLPSHHFVDGQLVRFRGMIQDMHNPEFFMASYEVHNSVTGVCSLKSGKFKDIVICEVNEEIMFCEKKHKHGERQSFYCISVPAVNQWAIEQNNCAAAAVVKDESMPTSGLKRPLEEDMEVEEGTNSCTQRFKVEETASSLLTPQIPLSSSPGQACILKVYDLDEKLVLNEEIEVVGFLSVDPNLSCLTSLEEGEENLAEQRALHPPPSLVPRLHVIAIQRMKHCVPFLPKFNYQPDIAVALQESASVLHDLRIVLTPILLGDQLATDFMICHLISKIFLRKDVTTLGHLSINFYNIPSEGNYVEKVYNILQQLVPKSHYLPLTLGTLNSVPFIPKKDYQSDQLKPGLLQLSDGTHLLVDETKLSPGQLGDLGTRNMLALQNLLAKHKVDYDFQFYQMEFCADIPILIFSEKKSLLSCDVPFPIEADVDSLRMVEPVFEAANNFLKNETVLNGIRKFLSAACLADYNIPDGVQEQVQQDFVDMRQRNDKMKGEDLHSMLVLARLLTLSKGQQSLTVDLWKEARSMEEARRARLYIY